MSSSNRPDINLALNIRSWERVMVIANQDSAFQYPEDWIRPERLSDADVDAETVVIVDRMDISREAMGTLMKGKPRLFAVAVIDIPHEKHVRLMLTSLHPWCPVWTFSTDFGKLLVTTAGGDPYDRDAVIDQRTCV